MCVHVCFATVLSLYVDVNMFVCIILNFGVKVNISAKRFKPCYKGFGLFKTDIKSYNWNNHESSIRK